MVGFVMDGHILFLTRAHVSWQYETDPLFSLAMSDAHLASGQT